MPPNSALDNVLQRIDAAAARFRQPDPRLLAVAKTRPAAAIAELAAAGQRAFGENYVREAAAKRLALDDPALEWHLIGHLQSNKAREAAEVFDWVQTIDRTRLVNALARHRPQQRPPLNVLVQVNIDAEASKHGCRPDEVMALAEAIALQPRLHLRGLMVIPAPHDDLERRRPAFRRARALFEQMQALQLPASVDTLSMGMSDDFELAISEGATMVRVGTALFGARQR